MTILGIESSCDECAASVVRGGKVILSNVIASQVELHRPYYGVVPEIASRQHTEAIAMVVSQALRDAGPQNDPPRQTRSASLSLSR